MSNPVNTLEKRFHGRPRWLQTAAARLLEKGSLGEKDIADLTKLAKVEAGAEADPAVEFAAIPDGALSIVDARHCVRLNSIADVKGVNALGPTRPLEFGDGGLAIVFGANGSGKSGYVRLLKNISGHKRAPDILPNVFNETDTSPSCSVSYTLDDKKKTESWHNVIGPIDDLRALSIYDTASAEIYINEDNEVTYEPPLLRLFRDLVDVSGKVEKALSAEVAKLPPVLPKLLATHTVTDAGKWYAALTKDTSDLELRCLWTEVDEKTLLDLTKRVAEPSPLEQAQKLRRTKKKTLELVKLFTETHGRLEKSAFDALQAARKEANRARAAATEYAQKVSAGALAGIGSATWLAMWEAARAYSTKEAYRDREFPHVNDGAKCVLCHQPLDGDAVARLTRFEEFVKGELERGAKNAEENLKNLTEQLESDAKPLDLAATLDGAEVNDASLREDIRQFLESLSARRSKFVTETEHKNMPALPTDGVSVRVSKVAEEIEASAAKFATDASADQKAALRASLAEANARKWISQQKAAIEAEILRLRAVGKLTETIKKTNTKWLSDTKSDLSQILITEAFVKRFKSELLVLGADRIKVKLEKSSAPKGQVLHRILIDGAKRAVAVKEVLSEGQLRIVSIAAFLADVQSRGEGVPFVFDDPVCSLDYDYESALAARLVALASTRQVIVFTHRLSMAFALKEAARKAEIAPAFIEVRHAATGAGEPDPSLDSGQAPKATLNTLVARLSKVKKLYEEPQLAEYNIQASAICSAFRSTIEKLVEVVLLNEVVKRFRRNVVTQDKLKAIAKVTTQDCEFLDDLMTRYSKYEHSYSDETPVTPPAPDALEKDLQAAVDWVTNFKDRAAAK